jgi:hypothetical protein
VSGQFKVGDVVKIVREPFYRNGDTKRETDDPIGTIGRISTSVDEDGDVELRTLDTDEYITDVSTECIELVDDASVDNLVITDAVILDRLDDIKKVAAQYASEQFYSASSSTSARMKNSEVKSHLVLFFLDVLAKLKEDKDGTI